jgi:hypothetical protein
MYDARELNDEDLSVVDGGNLVCTGPNGECPKDTRTTKEKVVDVLVEVAVGVFFWGNDEFFKIASLKGHGA